MAMQKTNVIIYVAAALVVGFIIGAIAGIKYSTPDLAPQAGVGGQAAPEAAVPQKVVSAEDIALYEDMVKKDPNNLNALINLGNMYFDTNQYQKAADAYQRALKIDPKNADVRTDMAIMYRNLKDYDRAVKELREAAASDPKHTNSRYNLGVVLLHDKRDIKGAIAAWEDFLKLEPGGERAAMIKQQLGQLREMAK